MIMKNSGGGEIVEVQGGHILRSTGRKDRHSKVITAKGPRDRRVRLSAHTAIQFYDVQDRLGYDRPSKAVDWLIKKARKAIDKLSELPSPGYAGDAFPIITQLGENSGGSSPLLPPQSVADSMKPFFPASSETAPVNFEDYHHEIMARQDLCLSLPSSQEPSSNHVAAADQTLFPASSPVTFEGDYQKVGAWTGGGVAESREGNYVLNSQLMPLHPFLFQSSLLSQRGTLQSSFPPPVHAWDGHTAAIQQSSFANGQFGPLQFPFKPLIHSQEKPSSAPPPSH